MASTIADLRVRVGADLQGFDKGMASVHSGLKNVKAQGDRVLGIMAGLAAGATGAAVGAFALVDSWGDMADQVSDLAAAFGLSKGETSAWISVANQVGSSVDTISGGFKFLAKDMDNARITMAATGKLPPALADAFKTLHVPLTDNHGKLRDLNAVMLDVADRFAAMPDGPAKAGLALRLFGKSGTDMIEILNLGSKGIQQMMDQGRALGDVMSTEEVEAAEKAFAAQQKLDAGLRGVKNTMSELLAPAVSTIAGLLTTKFLPPMRAFAETWGPAIVDVLTKGDWSAMEKIAPPWLQQALPGIKQAFQDIGKALGDIGNAIMSVVGPAWESISGFLGTNSRDVVIAIAGAIGGVLVIAFAALAVAVWSAVAPLLPFIALGAAIMLVITHWQDILNAAVRIWGAIRDWFAGIWDAITGKINEIWTGIVSWVTNTWNSILTTATTIFTTMVRWFVGWGVWFLETFTGPFGQILKYVLTHWDTITATARAVWTTITNFLGGVWSGIQTTAGNVWQGIQNAIITPIKTVLSTLLRTWQDIQSAIFGVWEGIKTKAGEIWHAIVNMITSPFKNIHIPLPHFRFWITWEQQGPVSIPKPNFAVDWYKEGGVFLKPAIIGVGDVPEAVIPLSDMRRGGGMGAAGPVYVIVELDGRQIALAQAPYLIDELRVRTGLRV